MKKVLTGLLLSFILIGTTGFVAAQNGNSPQGNASLCASEGEQFSQVYEEYPNKCCPGLTKWDSGMDTREVVDGECIDTGLLSGNPIGTCINCGNGICEDIENICNCPKDCDKDSNQSQTRGLGQIIRRRVNAGVYTNEDGEQIRVRELAQNRFEFKFKDKSAETELEIEEETENNKTKFKAKLSNGRNAEIKIMPNVASEKALTRLRLKRCNSSEVNCSIELKEVGEGNNSRLAYEVLARKTFRLFGFIKNKEDVMNQIDAETGEEINNRRPWWSWLASEEDDAEEI